MAVLDDIVLAFFLELSSPIFLFAVSVFFLRDMVELSAGTGAAGGAADDMPMYFGYDL